MRNKLFILIAAGSVLVIVGILGLVLVLGDDDAAPENTDTGFGDNAPDRPFDVTAADRPLSPSEMSNPHTDSKYQPTSNKLIEGKTDKRLQGTGKKLFQSGK